MAGKVRITEELLDLQTESDIKIIPVVHGEILLIGLGAAAIGIGVKVGVTNAILGSILVNVGLNLALEGVSDLLFPPPTPPKFANDEQDPSFIFTGQANISKSGVPINLVYGEMLIGTNTISANVDTLQVVDDD